MLRIRASCLVWGEDGGVRLFVYIEWRRFGVRFRLFVRECLRVVWTGFVILVV